MSLRLRQSIPGRPTSQDAVSFGTLSINDKGYVVYPSASNVVVLDHELELIDTLGLWDALPYRAGSSSLQDVKGVCCSQADALIVAWSSNHIVLWNFSPGKGRSGWVVHSTLVASSAVQCLDMKKGNLVLGTETGIELWRADLKASVTVWDRIWERSYPSPTVIQLAPSLSHIAWHQHSARSVYIFGLDKKGSPIGMPQELRHPREIEWIGWRQPKSTNGDSYLYTITTNSIFRIYSAVLDDPSWFQLLSSLDQRSFHNFVSGGNAKGKQVAMGPGSLWVWEADVLRRAIQADLVGGHGDHGVDVLKTLKALDGEESDVIAWVGRDGQLTLRSIVNMDRKPPTLLKSLPLSSLQLQADSRLHSSSRARLLHTGDNATFAIVPHPDSTLSSHRISVSALLESRPAGITPTMATGSGETRQALGSSIKAFARTPNGRGVLSLGHDGEISVWSKEKMKLPPSRLHRGPPALLGKGQWRESNRPRKAAIFAKGRGIVFYHKDEVGNASISLQHLDEGSDRPTPAVELPDFELDYGDEIEMLLAVSDIDDGYSGKGRRTQRAVIIAASMSGDAWIWRVISRVSPSDPGDSPLVDTQPEITLISKYTLPVSGGKPLHILPVDPMGWHQSVIDWSSDTPLQDMVLTISKEGVLEFWKPELGHHLVGGGESKYLNGHVHVGKAWTKSGSVDAGKRGIIMGTCSSRKKTVLICKSSDELQEMTIWDSNVGEFSTGLELTHAFPKEDVVRDLDWTTTSDLQSVLAVGFQHKIILFCEQRMSYVESTPGWASFITIDLQRYTSVPINDSIWLAGGSLAVGAGNQIYLFSRFLDSNTPSPTPVSSIEGIAPDSEAKQDAEDIFQVIAQRNGPLWDYHPVVLAQCLLWGESTHVYVILGPADFPGTDKIDLVKSILLSLVKALRQCENEGVGRLVHKRLDPLDFGTVSKRPAKVVSRKYDGLFDVASQDTKDAEDDFTPRLVTDLIDRLDGTGFIPLSYSEKSLLATIAQATLEIDNQRRSLDINGLRYLISIRMFVNQNRRAGLSGTATPASISGTRTPNGVDALTQHKSRLSFRNIVWATHSESQEVLLQAATECCGNGKMVWSDAKRLGVFLWLKSTETIKSQLEVIARNRFMADEDRDPTSCSLIFFALGKKKVVHGLWKQAPGHPEQAMMLKFLGNDFELERWKTAATKNAYALLSKQRYEYAAAFFMLAGSPKDAITVCVRQMKDWQLAIALARAVEGGTNGPIVKWLLSDVVVPFAFEGGHRWLATWAFWMLGRRDLAVRVLISPMTTVATAWSPDKNLTVGSPENDDPSLLLLFRYLKSKTLQTAKGTSEIAEKTEFDFVLHNARVFFRMGCHALALDLLRTWSFDRPYFPAKLKAPTPIDIMMPPLGLTNGHMPRRPSLISRSSSAHRPAARRPSFMLSGHARRESMVMDMDMDAIDSEPNTRPSTPPIKIEETVAEVKGRGEDAGEVVDPPKKMGNLMKEMKQDVQQGGMEFNMDSFF